MKPKTTKEELIELIVKLSSLNDKQVRDFAFHLSGALEALVENKKVDNKQILYAYERAFEWGNSQQNFNK